MLTKRELEAESARNRARLEARFNEIVTALQAHEDPSKRVAAALLPAREVTCPKCGVVHSGRAKKGYCHTCVTVMGWNRGGGEAFRARCGGVSPRRYHEDEAGSGFVRSDVPLVPLEEDPYAMGAHGVAAGAVDSRGESGPSDVRPGGPSLGPDARPRPEDRAPARPGDGARVGGDGSRPAAWVPGWVICGTPTVRERDDREIRRRRE